MTTTVNTRRDLGGRFARAATFGLLALVATLCAAPEARAQWTTSGTNTTTTNNVGVGTASPSATLHVQRDTNGTVQAKVYNPNVGNSAHSEIFIGQANLSSISLGYLNSGTPDGLYGVATNKPNTGYLVTTTNATGGLVLRTNANAPIRFVTSGLDSSSERMIIAGTGNIGIGTAAPNFKLDVNRGGDAADAILGIDANGSSAHSPMLYFRNTGTAISRIMSSRDLQFQNSNNTPLLYLTNTGNFGVGTTAPTTKLHVAGDIKVDGNISAKYQDVAEWVPSRQKLAAGTVVVLDIEHNNHVTASASAYDTRVAGVVSAQPGISLGEGGEGKALIATTGRVKVRVDATRAPIRVGDLLVTGDTPGVAMRSQPLDLGGVPIHRPGTLIGKALESLEKGTGEILVLLSLQ
jgi:hypothetical protein